MVGLSIKVNKNYFRYEEVSGWLLFTILVVYSWIEGVANQSKQKMVSLHSSKYQADRFYTFGGVHENERMVLQK